MRTMIDRAKRAGTHWFDRDTMRFFGSRVAESTVTQVGPDLYRFVSSELDMQRQDRRYSVRELTFRREVRESDGRTVERCSIDTIGDFRAWATLPTARRHMWDAWPYDSENRCRVCGEHIANPHAVGCPADSGDDES